MEIFSCFNFVKRLQGRRSRSGEYSAPEGKDHSNVQKISTPTSDDDNSNHTAIEETAVASAARESATDDGKGTARPAEAPETTPNDATPTIDDDDNNHDAIEQTGIQEEEETATKEDEGAAKPAESASSEMASIDSTTPIEDDNLHNPNEQKQIPYVATETPTKDSEGAGAVEAVVPEPKPINRVPTFTDAFASEPLDAETTRPLESPPIIVRQPTLPLVLGAADFTTSASNFLIPTSPSSRRSSESGSSSQLSRSGSNESKSGVPLKELMRLARKESTARPFAYFVPRCQQEALLTVAAVAKDIQAKDSSITEEAALNYAIKVCNSARRLYATLAFLKQGHDVCSLLREGLSDQDLPLEKLNDAQGIPILRRPSGRNVDTFNHWMGKKLTKFDEIQWWMTAPVFKDKEHYELHKKAVLPFIEFEADEETKERKQGAYSEVFAVKVHPSHHTFWDKITAHEDDEPLVAVKRLFSSEKREFDKEVSILTTLGSRRKRHPHLIRLLATYHQEHKYHLMFPYASANLRKYWEDRPNPEFNEATVMWSLKQMTGLASALQLIHNFRVSIALNVPGAANLRQLDDANLSVKGGEERFGRHGDIKPENILWFKQASETDDEMGVLQIADFGLGRFHGRDSKSGLNPDNIFSSPTYEPPECKLRRPVSRAYDIWSLGCVYLEFITWLLLGSDEIDGFSDFRGRQRESMPELNDDNFFTIQNGDATVRDKVIVWVNQLHAHPKCSAVIHDLLNLTMEQLLIINSDDRTKAIRLDWELKQILESARKDKDYLLTPKPGQHKAGPGNGRANSEPIIAATPKHISKPKQQKVSFSATEQHPIRNYHLSDAGHQVSEKLSSIIHTLPLDLVGRTKGTPNHTARRQGTSLSAP